MYSEEYTVSVSKSVPEEPSSPSAENGPAQHVSVNSPPECRQTSSDKLPDADSPTCEHLVDYHALSTDQTVSIISEPLRYSATDPVSRSKQDSSLASNQMTSLLGDEAPVNSGLNLREQLSSEARLAASIDHDYHLSSTLCKREVKQLELSSHMDDSETSLRTIGPSISSSVVPTSTLPVNRMPGATSAKPVLVRCINKNGVIVSLPVQSLTVVRNAVVIKPYGEGIRGNSLLRHPLICAAKETFPNTPTPRLGTPDSEETIPPLDRKQRPEPERTENNDMEKKSVAENRRFHQILERAKSTNWTSVRDCVRMLARDFSLTDSRAGDASFRLVQPFSASSLCTFTAWNVGKQRSAEWSRAKLIRRTLDECHFLREQALWSTKKILLWCRRQGYSPMVCWPKPKLAASALPGSELPSTSSSIKVDMLQSYQECDVTVDIEAVEHQLPKATSLANACCKSLVSLEDADPDLTSWIAADIEKLGFKLGHDMLNDSLVPVARLLMSRLWNEVATDLIRRSLRESWQRSAGKRTDTIALSDAYRAVIRRPEFDILTNAGVGCNRGVCE